MTQDRHTLVGIDVGGTKLAAGLLQWPSGQIIASRRQPTDAARGGLAVLMDVKHCLDVFRNEIQDATGPLRGVGIGVPELVDRHGVICSAATLDWQLSPIADDLARYARVPVVWEADVRAAARAEAMLGAGRGCDDFLYVSIGTGISCCLVMDGIPYRGARGLTGTFASSRLGMVDDHDVWMEGPPLEAVASGPAIAQRYHRRMASPTENVSTAEVFRRAEAGDRIAEAVVLSAAMALGTAIGQLVNSLDPDCVIVGGGVGGAVGLFRTQWEDTARRAIWSPLHRQLPIVSAECGGDAGWIGAALSCLHDVAH